MTQVLLPTYPRPSSAKPGYTIVRNRVEVLLPASLFTLATVPSDEVWLVHEVHCFGNRTPAATNLTLTFGFNGVSVPVNLPGAARVNYPEFHAYPGGSIVLNPGSTVSVTASIANQGHCYLVVERVLKGTDGAKFLTRPRAADDNAPMATIVSHGTLGAGSRTPIIDPAEVGPNKCVEITNIWVTGHGFNAATDSMLIEFDNGATRRNLWRSVRSGADAEYARPDIIEGWPIRGELGYGVSVTASTNLVSTCKVVVFYRLVDAHETLQPSGVPGTQATGGGRYFWFYSEQLAVDSSSTFVEPFIPGFGSGVQPFTASSVTTTTLTVTGAGWTTDQFKGHVVRVTSGGANGSMRRIVSNTADTISWTTAISTLSGTPTFSVIAPSGSEIVVKGISSAVATEGAGIVKLAVLGAFFDTGQTTTVIHSATGGGAGVTFSRPIHSIVEHRIDPQSQFPQIEFVSIGTTAIFNCLIRGEIVSNTGGKRGGSYLPLP